MMKTKTCKTIEILEEAKNLNDVDLVVYWLNTDQSLFDNFSDFLTALKFVK